ncbi:MAG: glycerophosphodiester phosphodiesterase family protein, partial [Pirellulales bacterium]
NVSDHPIVDRPFCDQVAAAGLELYVWTVDDPQRTAQLIDAGAAGVFTNRPGWLRQEVASLCSSPDN